MTARDNILRRIRERRLPAGAVELDPRVHPRPRLDGDPVARFRDRAMALMTTIDEAATTDAVPRLVAAYLRGLNLPSAAVCWPEFGALQWSAAGLDIEARATRADDLVGITGAYCAIAETGTLMTLSGADTPPTASLLPETHIAIVSRARVVPGMEDAWRLLRAERGAMPRAVNFISGPSRTADIEQTVTLGAHGPYRVHVVLVS